MEAYYISKHSIIHQAALMTKVYLKNYEPIGLCTGSEQYWSDVWLTYTVKPGRIKKRLAPTLISITALTRDLEIDQEIAKDNPDLNLEDNLANARRILADLAACDFVVDIGSDPKQPEIYTSATKINRRHAEKMLAHYLRSCGISEIKFKWKRVKSSETVIPVIV